MLQDYWNVKIAPAPEKVVHVKDNKDLIMTWLSRYQRCDYDIISNSP